MILLSSPVRATEEPSSVAQQVAIAKQLDRVAKRVEQYGSVAVSTPLLIATSPDASPAPFAFDLKRGASTYFTDAMQSVQGKSVLSRESSSTVVVQGRFGSSESVADNYDQQLVERNQAIKLAEKRQEAAEAAIRADYDAAIAIANQEADLEKRTAKINAATDRYIAALAVLYPAASALPVPGASPDSTARITGPTVAGAPASGLSATQAPLALTGLLGAANPSITARTGIIAAAGDNAVEGIFRALGDPGKALEFSGQVAYFGVAMVSVTPGRRTTKNFAADVSVVARTQLRTNNSPDALDLAGRWKERYGSTPTQEVAFLRLLCDIGNKGCLTVGEGKAAFRSLMGREPKPSASLDGPMNDGTTLVSATDAFDSLPSEIRGGKINESGTLVDAVGKSLSTACRGDVDRGCYLDEEMDPQVAALSPMTEAQILDLGNSSRERAQVALDLAAAFAKAGSDAAARIYADYATQLQRDSASRVPQNLVVGYSSGSVFGYQIGPGFVSMDGPATDQPKVGERLQRQSFPVLFILGMPEAVGRARVYLRTSDGKSRLVVVRPSVQLTQSTRWIPMRRYSAWFYRLTEVENVQSAQALDAVEGYLSEPTVGSSIVTNYLWGREAALKTLAFSSTTVVPFPEPVHRRDEFSVRDIAPGFVQLPIDPASGDVQDVVATFALLGTGLDEIDRARTTAHINGRPITRKATLNGVVVNGPQIALADGDDSAALLSVPLGAGDAGALTVTLYQRGLPDRKTVVGPVEIRAIKRNPLVPELRYVRKGPGDVTEYTVFGNPARTKTGASALIQADLEKDKPATGGAGAKPPSSGGGASGTKTESSASGN